MHATRPSWNCWVSEVCVAFWQPWPQQGLMLVPWLQISAREDGSSNKHQRIMLNTNAVRCPKMFEGEWRVSNLRMIGVVRLMQWGCPCVKLKSSWNPLHGARTQQILVTTSELCRTQRDDQQKVLACKLALTSMTRQCRFCFGACNMD